MQEPETNLQSGTATRNSINISDKTTEWDGAQWLLAYVHGYS